MAGSGRFLAWRSSTAQTRALGITGYSLAGGRVFRALSILVTSRSNKCPNAFCGCLSTLGTYRMIRVLINHLYKRPVRALRFQVSFCNLNSCGSIKVSLFHKRQRPPFTSSWNCFSTYKADFAFPILTLTRPFHNSTTVQFHHTSHV